MYFYRGDFGCHPALRVPRRGALLQGFLLVAVLAVYFLVPYEIKLLMALKIKEAVPKASFHIDKMIEISNLDLLRDLAVVVDYQNANRNDLC